MMVRRDDPRRLAMIAAIAAVVGLAAGGAAWVLLKLIGLITNVALFHQFAWKSPPFTEFHPGWSLFVAAIIGGLLVSLLAKWSPVIRGHGIPEAMEAVLTKHSRIQPRTAVAKPLSAAISIGTAGPFGAEGPIIVTGGALGSLIGQVIRVTPSERKILLASGAAAGMAATFGTPLAAAVLAIELLVFEFSMRALIPLMTAAAVAGGVHAALFGSGPFFSIPEHRFAGLATLPAFAVLGIAAGLVAVVIAKGLFLIEAGYRRLPFGEFWHPMLGAIGFCTIGLFVPRALGVGYDAITDVLSSKLALTTVAVLALAKLGAWWLALASGTSGGTLAPILLIAAGFGSLFGAAAVHVLPDSGVTEGAFALVAMAAVFGAATRATFASIIFVFELTGDYRAILPLMLATVLADLVAAFLLDESLMTEKLSRRGLRVQRDYEVDPLRTATVGALMAPADPSTNGHVTSVEVSPSDPAVSVLHEMLDAGADIAVVKSDGEVLGVCTVSDLVKARAPRMESDRLQPGWFTNWRSKTKPNSSGPAAQEV